MKPFWVWITFFGIIGLVLVDCLSATDETICEPAASQFATPVTTVLNDAYAPNVTITRVCTFSGHVARGQVYTHEIVKGLIFCLRPNTLFHKNDGWKIVINDTMDDNGEAGFNGIVTPPFHGTNAIDIEGSDFRNDKNTAENDGSGNAPQKIRKFNFVLNRSDFEKVWSAHRCVMWHECENGLTQNEAGKIIATAPKSLGVLIITNFELGNLISNDHAWFESMDFEVKIYLPAE
jgi:hypothetical protein